MLRFVLHAAREHRHRSCPTSSRMDVVHFGHSSDGASKWTDMAQATVDEALDVMSITPSNVVFFSPRAASTSTGRGRRGQAPMTAEVAVGLVGMMELGSGLPGSGKFESERVLVRRLAPKLSLLFSRLTPYLVLPQKI
ncbi:hypothetical protein GN958_ATG14806 [Phytophthora infestans]|uniref:Uncharacterized protein n=1 Tax=Phytophthora infestans TaxID=4787 RepID=A0A8S9U684_PHYIN|nr:hypothetical protein GN958_ATG14806 [Phytophthora infestans]